MPEGDSLRRLATRLGRRHVGDVVTASVVRHPRLATLDLTGRRLVDCDARGKHLLLRFEDGHTLALHLLMQGRVRTSWPHGVPPWRRRIEIRFGSGVVVGVDVPRLAWVATARESEVIGHLGPDLCGPYDHTAALDAYRAQRDRPLAEVLLDQSVVAGFGNIYAVEVPFVCGLSPFTAIDRIDGLDAVLSVGASLIRTNAALGPQNTTGFDLSRSRHWVLDARIRTCRVCGTNLERRETTPWLRRTAWCPRCQPERATSADRRRAVRLLALHPAARMLDPDDATLSADTTEPVQATVRTMPVR